MLSVIFGLQKKETSLDRNACIKRLKEETFELLVIGGGITGSGIALDAATRGIKTAQIEMRDFAFGTSSRSTKLIHGGLRYLKQLDFQLVNEVGRERAVVHQLAPHLVHPEKMLLPLISGGKYGKFGTWMGLSVYDYLAGVKGVDRRKMLDKEGALEIEPLLDESRLKGGGFYAEYRTDDARLTMAVARTASEKGVALGNYLKGEEFTYDEDGQINGMRVKDQFTGEEFTVKAKAVVNATGPWVDTLRKVNKSLEGKRLYLTKGIHIVLPHSVFPVKYTVYFDIPDGRMIFAIPRGNKTYVGTTDTHYTNDIANPRTSKKDVEYIVSSVNAMFPTVKLKASQIESSWAGLRPLIYEEGKSASEMSRKDEIMLSDTGLISISGGKLTGYRKMAERTVDQVCKKLYAKNKKCITDEVDLDEGHFNDYDDVLKLLAKIQKTLKGAEIDADMPRYLLHNYGGNSLTIVEAAGANPTESDIIKAELKYCIVNEMCLTLEDFFVRRTGRLYFNIESVRTHKAAILKEMSAYYSYSKAVEKEEMANIDRLIMEATTFPSELPT